MAKLSSKYVCNSCGYEALKWMGKCPGCGNWNSFIEEIIDRKETRAITKDSQAVPLDTVISDDTFRFSSGIGELDRVLGGGIVPGSLILLGGDPGIGKSTLLLQVADAIARDGKRVLYVSGEESLKQLKMRSLRLGITAAQNIYLSADQDIDALENLLLDIAPEVVIIDSIQTVFSSNISSIPGSVSQLRECTARIMEYAKKSDRAFFLVGHVTKEGALAGPKVLEHMVDVVVYFEGEKNFAFRLLRGVKNRFGSTDEIGLMEMSSQGLMEVTDPSYVFMTSGLDTATGTAIAASFEGSRPMLIEIQALVAASGPAYARRMASGIDQNRLSLIIAILEKRRGYPLASQDVYLKVTGGLFLKDPSVDLAIAAAIISSFRDKPLPRDTVYVGELSLSGQIRPVPFLEQRLKEIERMGFKRVILPESISGRLPSNLPGIECLGVKTIDDFIERITEG